MKKIILLASALALGTTAAYAQDASMQPPAATPDASAPAAAPAPATPDASMPAAAPDASAPAGGGSTGSATGPSGPVSLTPTQGPTDVPVCSKTVTDNCKQGGGKAMGGHKMMHKKKM